MKNEEYNISGHKTETKPNKMLEYSNGFKHK